MARRERQLSWGNYSSIKMNAKVSSYFFRDPMSRKKLFCAMLNFRLFKILAGNQSLGKEKKLTKLISEIISSLYLNTQCYVYTYHIKHIENICYFDCILKFILTCYILFQKTLWTYCILKYFTLYSRHNDI